MNALSERAGTERTGTGELWLDPLGDEAHRYDCTLRITADALRYTWQHEGKTHQGEFLMRDGALSWSDTWHQPQQVTCSPIAGAWGLFAVAYTYAAPGSPDWGWRTVLSERPSGELVLQMTNITPWGEEARAVRMVFRRAPS